MIYNSSVTGLCRKTTTQSTASPPLNGSKKNKKKVLEQPSQSPDWDPIEMLWQNLKWAVCAQNPSNVVELKQFCKEEWNKIPPQRRERLQCFPHIDETWAACPGF
ncbi:hypothetical protein LDENG_00094910 [Lucifuga dentata]|nr:hypothetical protein LDENG_00094910 [Lucifuga dentata]